MTDVSHYGAFNWELKQFLHPIFLSSFSLLAYQVGRLFGVALDMPTQLVRSGKSPWATLKGALEGERENHGSLNLAGLKRN